MLGENKEKAVQEEDAEDKLISFTKRGTRSVILVHLLLL
jgi:hypothetical protein